MEIKTLKINSKLGIYRISKPKWQEVEENIRRMDGKNYTEISLIINDANVMLITGGYKGAFLCEILVNNIHKGLIHLEKSADFTVSVIENEPSDFEEYIISDLETVIIAAKNFFDYGVANNDMIWEET